MIHKLILTLSLITFLVSCNDDDDNNNSSSKEVQLANNDTFGSILTDLEGNTLYFFSQDSKGLSSCTGECEDFWPVFYKENLTVDSGLDMNDFGVITREDGSKQNTYKGWPLYYFINDNEAGDTNGDKVNNVWFVAKPDYSLMYVSGQLVGHDGENYKSDYTVGEEDTFYITDDRGNTLYSFFLDKNAENNFTESDFSNNSVWPIAEITLDKVPSILNADDFDEIDVFGRKQITYKGWPLYYFGQDTSRGDNKGISFPEPGFWPIVNTMTTVAPPSN